ncbi:MAG TPA: GAF domain-containing protein, partial [Terriglobales bacterium]|nr:GAF domain-containing protein [Terriglobales bacterium]
HVPRELLSRFVEIPIPLRSAPGHQAMWRTRRAVWTSDAPNDPRFDAAMMRIFPHRSNLCVPMVVKGEPVGAFVVIWWTDARVVTPDEVRLVEGISEQAAMFIDNAQLYEALQARLAREQAALQALRRSEERQAAFAEIVKEIAGETDLDRALALIARRTCDLFAVDTTLIALTEGPDVVLRSASGITDVSMVAARRRIDESRVRRVIRERRVVTTPDMTADPVWADARLVREGGYRATLEAPIVLHDEVIGVIGALHRAPRMFGDEDCRLLGALAEHAALAVDRGHLRADRENRLRETERLLAVTQAAASTFDFTEVARRMVREMVRALDADMGGAWMLARSGEAFIPLAGYHVPEEARAVFASTDLEATLPLLLDVRLGDRAIAVEDSANDRRLAHPLFDLLGHRALLICPLRHAGELLGAVALVWTRTTHACTPEEIHLVEAMSRHAAVGFDNARLLATERETRERLAASETRYRELFDNINDVVYVHDLEGRITEINDAAVPMSGYSRAELIGRNVVDLIAPADRARVIRAFRTLTASGAGATTVFAAEFLGKAGPARMLECSARLIYHRGSAVGVLGVARDLTAHRRHEARQAVVIDLGRELATGMDLDALLDLVARRVRALMESDAVLLLLRDGARFALRGAAGAELLPAAALTDNDGVAVRVSRDRRPVVYEDLDGDVVESARPFAGLGYRAMVVVPLIAQDRVLGVLEVLHRAARGVTDEDVAFLEGLATTAALAIDNTRLLAQTRARLRETEVLLAIDEAVMPTLDLAERMRRLARGACRAFGADMGGAYLVDSGGLSLVPVASYRVPPNLRDKMRGVAIPIDGHRAVAEAVRTQLPVPAADLIRDERFHPDLAQLFPSSSGVFAPILGDRLIGGVVLVWWGRERPMDLDERKLLAAICRHAALFVGNANLFMEATARRQEAEELAGHARSLVEDLDVTEVGRRTVDSARQLLRARVASLRTLRADRTLSLVASSGAADLLAGPELPLDGTGLVARAASSGRPVTTLDVLADPAFAGSYGHLRESLAIIAVPLHTKGTLVGVLTVADRPGRVFHEREISLLSAFADQAAVALDNSRLYGELRQAVERAEESQQRIIEGERLRALGELAGGVAHDFNNVLAIIVGRLEALHPQLPADVQRELDVVLRVAFDGAQTVQRIQSFSRKRRARPFQRVDLNELVHEVVEVTRSRWKDAAQARGVTYDMVVECIELPTSAGEPAELREALTNLVFNALDAMPGGGTVTIRTGIDGEGLFVTVQDTGVGMPEAVRRRIFDPFFTTKGERGTGLGLSVVYGIVTRHGGRIEVASRLGHGAAFTVRLPLSDPAAPPPIEPTVDAFPARARVLVVDDEAEIRDVLTTLFTHWGHEVVACEDGDTAIGRFESETFDLVVTDLGMPGISGWTVARAVKARNPETPVVMVTGWREQISETEAHAEGVDYLLSKPFRRAELRTVVAHALRTHT